jgi:hypothetical protein
VENVDIKRLRRNFDPGKVGFGQSNRSRAYEEAVRNGVIIEKDWCLHLPEKVAPGYGPGQALGPKAGCMYQLFIALATTQPGARRVGTLTIGFKQNPGAKRAQVESIMGEWATEKRPYVQYLKANFNLGGRPVDVNATCDGQT